MGLFDKENTKPFLTEIENRRTIYKTKTSISISDEELEEMIEHIVKYMPSALIHNQHVSFYYLMINILNSGKMLKLYSKM